VHVVLRIGQAHAQERFRGPVVLQQRRAFGVPAGRVGEGANSTIVITKARMTARAAPAMTVMRTPRDTSTAYENPW